MSPSTSTPTPRVGTRSAQAQATRERVLAAARECVLEFGPLDASSNEIARRAGVSWGVIQYHFGTRTGILLAMIESGFGELLETLDPPESVDRPLEFVVDAVWDYYSQPDYVLYTDVLRMLRRDPSSRQVVEDTLRESEAQLDRRIARLLGSPTVSDEVLHMVRHLIFATMRGLAFSRSLEPHPADSAAERRFLVRALHLAMDDAAADDANRTTRTRRRGAGR